MTLIARAPDPAAFAPFGALIEPPQTAGDRRMFSDWVAPVEGLSLQFHINSVAPMAVPAVLDQVERHPHSAQAFVPMDVSRYLVVVMPSTEDGRPDPAGVSCFAMPGNIGVVYRRGVWHAGIMVLDRPGNFAVLMSRGAPHDDLFCAIPPLSIAMPHLGQTGTRP